MVKAKKYILQNQYDGVPKETDVKILEEELPPLKDGQFLCESVFLSVDPYQRAYHQEVGNVLIGRAVAKIIESKSSKYPVGKHILGDYGWRTHHILDDEPPKGSYPIWTVPESLGAPLSYFLGVLGMPGVTANRGFLDICQPKEGETVIVTGAAGAVGSLVGQIAKIKGCKVFGVVGSDQKGEWITKDLKFDGYVNYKKGNIAAELKKLSPDGFDCYFDNVGGEISSIILKQMKLFGRISVCGAISAYNNLEEATAPIVQRAMIFKQLKMEGFIVSRWVDKFEETIEENAKWLKEGKLKTQETRTKGFENTFSAFTSMLKGGNIGKAIVEL